MYAYETKDLWEDGFDAFEPEGYAESALMETPEPGWVEWQRSPKQSSRRGQPITAIIYHFTAGPSLEGTLRTFSGSSSRQASAHYVLGKDGRIVQMVPLDRAAWHAGQSALAGRQGVNRFSIGIEIVNWGHLPRRGQRVRKTGQPCRHAYCTWTGGAYRGPQPVPAGGQHWEPFTDAQYRALIRLTRYLVSRYPTITHITGHEDIALPRGRKSDPGPAFDWARIRAALSPAFRGHVGPLRTAAGARVPARAPTRARAGARAGSPIPRRARRPTLQRGSRGAAVAALQQALNRWLARARGRSAPRLRVDGIFGSGTYRAVLAFQRASGLPPSGTVGSRTWARLTR